VGGAGAAVTPARAPRGAMRLLALDTARGRWTDGDMGDLPQLLQQGDLLVLNDAATLPASLPARTSGGDTIELRLAGQDAEGGPEFWAVAFGAGGWRQRTEDRPAPPSIPAGSTLFVGRTGAAGVPDELPAQVCAVSPLSPRLLRLRFAAGGDSLWPALYRHGRPVQYSHLARPLDLWDVQTPYHARPWAMEMPSAGRGLTLPRLQELRRAGVRLATLTHAAGLSSTGDAALDAALPLPERYEIPPATVRALGETRAAGGRVVAVGTTVVRALESAAAAGGLGAPRAGAGTATLRIGPGFRPRVVDGLLTGVHDDGTSHFELLKAFAPEPLLEQALRHAQEAGYLGHEFGDALLISGPAPGGGAGRDGSSDSDAALGGAPELDQGQPGVAAARGTRQAHLEEVALVHEVEVEIDRVAPDVARLEGAAGRVVVAVEGHEGGAEAERVLEVEILERHVHVGGLAGVEELHAQQRTRGHRSVGGQQAVHRRHVVADGGRGGAGGQAHPAAGEVRHVGGVDGAHGAGRAHRGPGLVADHLGLCTAGQGRGQGQREGEGAAGRTFDHGFSPSGTRGALASLRAH